MAQAHLSPIVFASPQEGPTASHTQTPVATTTNLRHAGTGFAVVAATTDTAARIVVDI